MYISLLSGGGGGGGGDGLSLPHLLEISVTPKSQGKTIEKDMK